jgi:hypothetical protein
MFRQHQGGASDVQPAQAAATLTDEKVIQIRQGLGVELSALLAKCGGGNGCLGIRQAV